MNILTLYQPLTAPSARQVPDRPKVGDEPEED